MSDAISGLLGALVGGLAALAGSWLQARSAAKLQQEVAAQQREQRQAEEARSRKSRQADLARRYLYQFGDAVDSLRHRSINWARQGGPRFADGLHPGYWEVTSLYSLARALAAERVLALEGAYVDLDSLQPKADDRLQPRAVEDAVKAAFGHNLFRYHRLALAESLLDLSDGEFRILTYSEFLRRYHDPEWNLKSLFEPVRKAFGSLGRKDLESLEQALGKVSVRLSALTAAASSDEGEAF